MIRGRYLRGSGLWMKPGPAPLDLSSPFARGLLACVPLWEGAGTARDIAQERAFAITQPFAWTLGGTAVWTTGRAGRGIRFNGTSGDLLTGPTLTGTAPPADFTHLVVFSVSVAPGTGAMLLGYADASASNFQAILGLQASGVVRSYTYTGSSQFQDSTAVASLAPDVHVGIATIKSNGLLRVYLDGIAGGSQNIGTVFTIASPLLYVSRTVGSFPDTFNGTVYFLASWSRILSVAEVMTLSADPYQLLFRGQRRQRISPLTPSVFDRPPLTQHRWGQQPILAQ